MPDPRCVMPTLSQGDELPQDPTVLRTVIKSNRLELEEGARFPASGCTPSPSPEAPSSRAPR
jgi:hypothetical protein